MDINSELAFNEALKEIARLTSEMLIERTARKQLIEEKEGMAMYIAELSEKIQHLEEEIRNLKSE